MARTMPMRRLLVGSTAGRGPCDCCGLTAELHLVTEEEQLGPARWTPRRVLAVCLPCAAGVEQVRAPGALAA